MQSTRKIKPREMFRIGAALAFVGGFLDAYTYLLRGGVFANAQTGNVVLLSIYLAEGKFAKACYYIAPILAFVLGVLITEYIKVQCNKRNYIKWEHIVLGVEILLLGIIGFLPAGIPNGIVNVTIAFVCSVQVNSFRKVHNITYASTMCTGNLRAGTESLFRGIQERDSHEKKNAMHYFGIIALFIVGAALGTLLVHYIGIKSIWICCAILIGIYWVIR